MAKRIIMHYDMDAFYASVEIKNNPKYKGKPLVVAGGVVTTASYEARKLGIKSAMPLFEAKKLCRTLVVCPVNHQLYSETSALIQSLVKKITHKVEFIALDEGYVDITDVLTKHWTAEDFAKKFQERIKNIVGLTCSVGIGYNKLTAKIASDINKPAGIYIFENEQEFVNYIKDKPINKIQGVGKKLTEILNKDNVFTPNDLYNFSEWELRSKYGESRGNLLYYSIRGIDESVIEYNKQTYSIGNENSYKYLITSPEELELELKNQFQRAYERLQESGLFAKTVSVKIRYENLKAISRSYTRSTPTANKEQLMTILESIIFDLDEEKEFESVRLAGVSFSNLSDKFYEQLRLFNI